MVWCVSSILPLIVLLTVPHAVLGFVTTLANLCELVGTNEILIIAL